MRDINYQAELETYRNNVGTERGLEALRRLAAKPGALLPDLTPADLRIMDESEILAYRKLQKNRLGNFDRMASESGQPRGGSNYNLSGELSPEARNMVGNSMQLNKWMQEQGQPLPKVPQMLPGTQAMTGPGARVVTSEEQLPGGVYRGARYGDDYRRSMADMYGDVYGNAMLADQEMMGAGSQMMSSSSDIEAAINAKGNADDRLWYATVKAMADEEGKPLHIEDGRAYGLPNAPKAPKGMMKRIGKSDYDLDENEFADLEAITKEKAALNKPKELTPMQSIERTAMANIKRRMMGGDPWRPLGGAGSWGGSGGFDRWGGRIKDPRFG